MVQRVEARTGAQPPEEPNPPRIEAPATVAAGFGAMVHTMLHTARHSGIVRGALTLLRTNQVRGFDCPGCAWPEGIHERSSFEFCENGAKAVASETTKKRLDAAFFRHHSVDELTTHTDHWLNDQGRLTEPMVLEPGATHYRPIDWDAAFALVAEELLALPSPDAAAFYTSGRTSNEAAFLFQALARSFGTNNLPDCSNMCHESSGAGMDETLGVGKGTVSLDDFELADAIFLFGQNPGTNHPRMLSTLQAARARGASIVSVNPIREAGTVRFAHPQDPVDILGGSSTLASLHLAVRINGDVALLKGIMKAMLEEEARRGPGSVLDLPFLDAHTSGFEALRASLESASWDHIEASSGIARADIEAAAKIAWESERTIVCWAMGITQHQNGVANVREIVNLLLLRGNMGRPGAGACPVRGHSNVQGDRTMGIWEKMPAAFLDALGRELAFAPPRAHGFDTVETIEAMERGDVRVFFAMGGNFVSAAPDTERTAAALRRCALTVHVSTKLHRGHLVTGRRALILPCLGRSEIDAQASGPQFVTVENSMSVVSRSQGDLEPASKALKSEVAIVAGLGRALEKAAPTRKLARVDWTALEGNYDRIRDHIAHVVPGFHDFNARVREPGGFTLPNAARARTFRTRDQKARFTVNPIPAHALEAGELLMMTIRSHDQYNTTVYGNDDRYRGVFGGRRVVFMNAADVSARGLKAGDRVDLTSRATDGIRTAQGFFVVPYDIPPGNAATYFPEANVLVALGAVAETSKTPVSKSVVIRVHPAP